MGRKISYLVAAPLALSALAACGGDTDEAMAEGQYDADAPSLEEVSTSAELANGNVSTEELVTNEEVTE